MLITSSKTDPGGIGHTFFISPSPNQRTCAVTVMQSYINCFPEKERSGRFSRMIKDGKGKCFENLKKIIFFINLFFYKNFYSGMQRPIGKNTLGLYPKKCAAKVRQWEK